MEIILPVVLFVAALILVLKGGDFLVDGAIWLARVTRIPDMVIGATVVSIATTLPEVIVSTLSVAKGTTAGLDFGINNGTGSMIFNILMIVGVAALCAPSIIEKKSFTAKAGILVAATGLLFVFCLTGGGIDKVESAVLLACFVAFIGYNLWEAKKGRNTVSVLPAVSEKPTWLNVMYLVVGAVCIGFGAKLLVDNGMAIASFFGISEAIIGLTVVAAGTSLPELVTTLKSVRRGVGGLGIGNIIGANIINCTLLIGACGLICPSVMPVEGATLAFTLPTLLISALLLILPTAIKGKTYRAQGAAMLIVFAAYLTLMILTECGLILF